MIKRTTDMLRLNGMMVLATAVIRDEQHSDPIKHMPDVYAGDMTYWFVIGEKGSSSSLRIVWMFCRSRVGSGAPGDTGEGKTIEGYSLEKYNYYKVVKQERKSRPLHTIPRY